MLSTFWSLHQSDVYEQLIGRSLKFAGSKVASTVLKSFLSKTGTAAMSTPVGVIVTVFTTTEDCE